MSHSDKPAKDTDVAEAMRRLEAQIVHLRHMAVLMADALDDDLGNRELTMKDGHAIFHIRVSKDRMEVLSFAWNDVLHRIDELSESFFAAWKGEIKPWKF